MSQEANDWTHPSLIQQIPTVSKAWNPMPEVRVLFRVTRNSVSDCSPVKSSKIMELQVQWMNLFLLSFNTFFLFFIQRSKWVVISSSPSKWAVSIWMWKRDMAKHGIVGALLGKNTLFQVKTPYEVISIFWNNLIACVWKALKDYLCKWSSFEVFCS